MKKIFYILFLVFVTAIFSFFSCDSNPSETPSYPFGIIKGRVIDAGDNTPLAGVTVSTSHPSNNGISDTSGRYVVSGVHMQSTGEFINITYSRANYVSLTITKWISVYDTLKVEDVKISPSSGVFVANNLLLQQSDSPQSYSNLDLNNLIVVPTTNANRDMDLRDSANAKLRFKFMSSISYPPPYTGYWTKFGNSLGSFSKYDFDTLAMYYGASVPLSDADFPNSDTKYFYTPLTEQSVVPFYLYGRYLANPGSSKIYGLLYIKSSWIDTGNNRFMVLVDVKINKNGENYFIPNK